MIATTKLRKAMHDIAVRKGDFTLFGVFMRAGAPDTWDLVVAAPWLHAGKLKALGEFVQLLSKSIGESNLRQFSRVAALDENDPALNAVLAAMSVDDGEVRIQRSNFFGLDIEDAIIFRAKRPTSSSARAV